MAIAADRVADGISTPTCTYEEAIATAAEMAVGATSWKAKVGSKPGGGSMWMDFSMAVELMLVCCC